MVPDFKYRDDGSNYPYLKSMVSLGEVVTPILNFDDVSMKLEYFSPTFSYKDRGSKTLISSFTDRVDSISTTEINEDSSGNAGASIAAYGTRAGFKVNIFVPETTRAGKISQIEAYGARIVKVSGGRDNVAESAERNTGLYASHVMNPEFRDGIREIAYEIFRQGNGKMPDNIFVPVSAGTLLIGLFNGLKHLLDSNEIGGIPTIVAVQTNAVNPLCSRINESPYDPEIIEDSVADALVSRKPVLLDRMTEIVKEYGRCLTVDEQSIIEARRKLSSLGVYAEYSSATVMAAFTSAHLQGKSLLLITGNGLKTP